MGGTGLFAKLITLPAVEIIPLRCVVAALTLLVFVKLTGTRLVIERRADMGWIFLMGAIVSVHWVAFFTSVQTSTVAIALIASFTFPAMKGPNFGDASASGVERYFAWPPMGC